MITATPTARASAANAWQAYARGGGAVLAIGLGADWACTRYPAEMPVWAPWSFSWPEYLAAACGLWWYCRGVRLMPAAQRPAAGRRTLYVAGIALIWIVLQTRLDEWAQHMFFIDRIRHIVTHHLGPFLIALAQPGATLRWGMPTTLHRLARRIGRSTAFRVLQQPVLAASLFVGLVVLWLVPAVQFHAMLNARLYDFMNWSMVIDGLLFWCLVLDPRPPSQAGLSYVARMAAAFLVMFPMILLGTLIESAQHDVYSYYALCGRLIAGLSAVADQQIGGLIIWVPAGMMSALATLLIASRQFAHEDRVGHEDGGAASAIREPRTARSTSAALRAKPAGFRARQSAS
jgi:putative membrane protein